MTPQLQAVWKEQYEASRSRVQEAVEATRGEIMTYEGEPITAFFFASSGGHTAEFGGILQRCAALSAQRGISLGRSEVDSDHVSDADMHEGGAGRRPGHERQRRRSKRQCAMTAAMSKA